MPKSARVYSLSELDSLVRGCLGLHGGKRKRTALQKIHDLKALQMSTGRAHALHIGRVTPFALIDTLIDSIFASGQILRPLQCPRLEKMTSSHVRKPSFDIAEEDVSTWGS